VSDDSDAQAELNEACHADALKALSPNDVLATVDDLVAQMCEVGASYDPRIEAAITR
jgi:hypothetical protein